MLSVTPSENAAAGKSYFQNGLQREGYYAHPQELPGQWLRSKGNERLQLQGEVKADDFYALCDNKNPNTGEKLTPRTKKDRTPGYDITISSCKSASVIDGIFGADDIRTAFVETGQELMQDHVEPLMHTRVRINGKDEDRATGEMVVAQFLHLTARPPKAKTAKETLHPDPHLHGHFYALNTTFDASENRWKAGKFDTIKSNAPDLELEFDARYAKRLRETGYVPVPSRYGFQLAGVPQSVIDKFSRRRDQIEAEAAEKGITDAKGKHQITRANRAGKRHDLTMEQLQGVWDGMLTQAERSALERVRLKQVEPGPTIDAAQSVQYAIRHRFQREDFVSLRDLKKEAVYHGIGQVMPADVEREIAQAIAREKLILVQSKDGTKGVTTRDALEAQEKMLAFARDGRGQYMPLRTDTKSLELEGEQRQAALHVLESRDQVIGIRGGAGTGKTHMLKNTVKTLQAGLEKALQEGAEGRQQDFTQVFAFAPSATASRGELRKAGFDSAETLATLLVNKELQKKTQNQIILVDEAGMISTRDMNRLFDIAKGQNARVVLLGDYRQHASVDAGDAFRLLKSEGVVQFAELQENRRQKVKNYRDAVNAIGDGTPEGAAKGVRLLDKQGSIIEIQDREKLLNRLVGGYLDAVDKKSTALIVGTTHAEGGRITRQLRKTLRERGQLGKEETAFTVWRPTQWTEPQKEDARNYQPGMVIQFHKATPGVRKSVRGKRETTGGFKSGEAAVVLQGGANIVVQRQDGTRSILSHHQANHFQVYTVDQINISPADRILVTKNGRAMAEQKGEDGPRLNNGDIFTVKSITPEGHIKTGDGKVISANYSHLSLGYVDTSYASQGKTVDHVFIAVDPKAQRATNQTQWYVSTSRAQHGCQVFVSDKDLALAAAQRSGAREAAIELVRQARAESQKNTLQEKLFEMDRVVRYFKERAQHVAEYIETWRDRVRRGNEGRNYA